jgi:hypothetical protein
MRLNYNYRGDTYARRRKEGDDYDIRWEGVGWD